MRRLLIAGATGSVGTTALNAIRKGLVDARPSALIAGSSDALVSLGREFGVPVLKAKGKSRSEISSFIDSSEPDMILNSVSGADGLLYSALALEKGIDLALSNKETLTMGGKVIKRLAEGRNIYPVDSEHSAIWSLLREKNVERIIITASGGPFRMREDLSSVTVQEALAHPVWSMGPKITIDSATMANKGLEVIEASVLFSLPCERIDVIIHPESVIHSMAVKKDGSVKAFMAVPDMTLPVVTALNGGEDGNAPGIVSPLCLEGKSLHFESWSPERFPLLKAAYDSLSSGGAYTAAFTASDERAVKAFLSGRIPFTGISKLVLETLEHDWSKEPGSIEEIMEVRRKAEELCSSLLSSC